MGGMEQVTEVISRAARERARRDRIPTVSFVSPDGTLLEMIHDVKNGATAFARSREDSWDIVPDYELPGGKRLVPLSPTNNLLEHGVVRFAETPEEYGPEQELAEMVRGYIHRYVNAAPNFERIAAAYVLLSWVADTFNELPYLRVRGGPGTGKTRFLLTVGAICAKPIFASGASTVSPIFRILDLVRGTLVLDESDFRHSDEKAEIVKILNNGNARGFPVLRTDTVPGSKEFNPRAYHVYGPKLIATRGFFDDSALESRFLTEEMDSSHLRPDIPISLPDAQEIEARSLRNRLLRYRFRRRGVARDLAQNLDRSLEPRLAQMFAPMFGVAEDEDTRNDLRALARSYQHEIVTDRGFGLEADLLAVLCELWTDKVLPPTVREVVGRLTHRDQAAYANLTAKRVGWMLRKRLGIDTVRGRMGYVVPQPAKEKLEGLAERYGAVGVNDQSTGSSQRSRSAQEADQA